MPRFARSLILLMGLVCLVQTGTSARAQTYGKAPIPGDKGPDAPKNVSFDDKRGTTIPLDLEFHDHDGRSAPLREYIGGKPTILVMHYNRCPKLCNEVIRDLMKTLNTLRASDPNYVAGGPFNLILVSVDPREAPTMARKNRELFLSEYDRRSPDAPGVWFLTASQGQGTDLRAAEEKIHALSSSVGFNYSLRYRNKDYVYDPATTEWKTEDGKLTLPAEPRNYDYGHASGITFLTGEGVVSKYLYGLAYSPRDVRLALNDASGGKIGSAMDRVYQFCFVYDEVKGHYKLTMRYVAIAFTPVMLGVMFIAFRTLQRVRREPALLPGQAFPGQEPVMTTPNG